MTHRKFKTIVSLIVLVAVMSSRVAYSALPDVLPGRPVIFLFFIMLLTLIPQLIGLISGSLAIYHYKKDNKNEKHIARLRSTSTLNLVNAGFALLCCFATGFFVLLLMAFLFLGVWGKSLLSEDEDERQKPIKEIDAQD